MVAAITSLPPPQAPAAASGSRRRPVPPQQPHHSLRRRTGPGACTTLRSEEYELPATASGSHLTSALVIGEAAVDVEGLAGDEVAVGGQQEGHGTDQVGGDLDPAQGGGGGHGRALVRGDGLAFDLGG